MLWREGCDPVSRADPTEKRRGENQEDWSNGNAMATKQKEGNEAEIEMIYVCKWDG